MHNRIAISLAKPNSVGNIKLKSRDYNDPPLIDPNYLDDPTDVPRLIEGNVVIHGMHATVQHILIVFDFFPNLFCSRKVHRGFL